MLVQSTVVHALFGGEVAREAVGGWDGHRSAD
jgi:hypothetical protein